MRVAINGLGRIGRTFLRAALRGGELEIVAINEPAGIETAAHLVKYDSSHGTYPGEIRTDGDFLVVDGKRIHVLGETEPAALPWARERIDVVVEAAGRFTSRGKAAAHLAAGAKRVVISAPSPDPDITIVMGVNDRDYRADLHHIISNASCTTNCLAPMLKVLDEKFGIRKTLMTTVHPYTNNQQLHDGPHADLRRGRAAALSIVPTTTTAIQAVLWVMPQLTGRIDGMAIRVPTANVANIDLVAELAREVDVEALNAAFRESAEGELQGILAVCADELVSMDYRGNPLSAIVDLPATQVVDGKLARILAWYDNEAGYSNRLVDLVKMIGREG
ncbi:type I glyceraldehyde-3-phosphate dehydrogenase [Geomesophilobacter sediminis]|uniref:Glyceraldehyde-3-phosphate dehydrogenase n=1 Tax=Geomesophilobacter sediminis TaxID=2798584 RepID=A0A8J7LUG5_9BACT|nr:type I glyceraldehyde-3-phosphate dehydrogenase [Geomesophilobacter sediminis]MBJ6723715.1 type I glyceraldehyde-3-phosphate dehydrogenase [Geomesophilobacter sediminis]